MAHSLFPHFIPQCPQSQPQALLPRFLSRTTLPAARATATATRAIIKTSRVFMFDLLYAHRFVGHGERPHPALRATFP